MTNPHVVAKTITVSRVEYMNLCQTMDELVDYFDERADIQDTEDGHVTSNEAMRFGTAIARLRDILDTALTTQAKRRRQRTP